MSTPTARILAHLAAQWRRVFRLTTIDQACAALGIAPTWTVRRAVAARLLAAPDLSPVLRRWGVGTVALSNEERLLGRVLAAAGQPLTVAELAARAGVPARTVRARLRLPAFLGIVALDGATVALAPDHLAKLGPLGWLYQSMQLDDTAAFNIPCPVDFLLLAHGSYRDRRLTLRGTCASSDAPIRVEAAHGAITAVDPTGALVFRGGG